MKEKYPDLEQNGISENKSSEAGTDTKEYNLKEAWIPKITECGSSTWWMARSTSAFPTERVSVWRKSGRAIVNYQDTGDRWLGLSLKLLQTLEEEPVLCWIQ
jgi:hypothetical protein